MIDKDNEKKMDTLSRKMWHEFNLKRGYNWNEKTYKFLVRESAKIVGFVSFKINGGTAYLLQLIVSKKSRKKGIGEILLKKVEDFARNKKCHVVYLDTSDRHKEALEFYKKQHYKIVAKLKNNKFHFTWYYLEKKI